MENGDYKCGPKQIDNLITCVHENTVCLKVSKSEGVTVFDEPLMRRMAEKEIFLQAVVVLIDHVRGQSASSHGEQVREDAKRLDFMLTKCRKVIVERLPHDNLKVYVEEGFLGDKRYPSVRYSGDWETGEPYALAIQREAIDAAMLAAAPSAGSQEPGE